MLMYQYIGASVSGWVDGSFYPTPDLRLQTSKKRQSPVTTQMFYMEHAPRSIHSIVAGHSLVFQLFPHQLCQ